MTFKIQAAQRIQAAKVSEAKQAKFIRDLLKLDPALKEGEIRKNDPREVSFPTLKEKDFFTIMKKHGWVNRVKDTKPGPFQKKLTRKDGTWPIGYFTDMQQGKLHISAQGFDNMKDYDIAYKNSER